MPFAHAPLLFRSLAPAEGPALAALQAILFDPGEVWSRESLSMLLEDPRALGRGGFAEDGALCAFMLARAVAGEGEILTLGVHPAHQRQGYARQMVGWLQGESLTNGWHTLFLEVAEDNTPARALYERAGFDAVGRRPDYYAGRRSGVVLQWTPPPLPDKGGTPDDGEGTQRLCARR